MSPKLGSMSSYKRSRYTLQKQAQSGVYLHNTLSGKGGRYPLEAVQLLRTGRGDRALRDRLVTDGHLVEAQTDEFATAAKHQMAGFFRNEVLHLILFPTEKCNFRCVYCYEKFELGAMRAEVREGVKNLVRRRASGLKELYIGWFGGEPLLVSEVVLELSKTFVALSQEHGFAYQAHATTNGYFLTPELHNPKRKLAEGGPTFERIWQNLLFLKGLQAEFQVTLRINLDQENYPQSQKFIRLLGATFGSDPRFELHLHPVGKWGGANDQSLKVLDDGYSLLPELYRHGKNCGLSPALGAGLNPFGSVCYAAKPYSFAIRADGRVNKCTIALEDDRNQVGRLLPDGTLLLNQEKFKPWVFQNALTDSGCQACSLRPACQGAACPLERMNTGQRPCPDVKTRFKDYLPLLLNDIQELEVIQ